MVSSGIPHQVEYRSRPVSIPDDFLRSPPAKPVTLKPVPWTTGGIPEYEGCYAVTIDNVLSQEECDNLTRLAESSVPPPPGAPQEHSPWQPAMVSLGDGFEILSTGYRESDRIIWDQQEIVDRIWGRVRQAEGIEEKLAVFKEPEDRVLGIPKWDFRCVNKRMRFLQYTKGQFFKAHCDGPFWYEEDGKDFQTHYTMQLYLNDSAAVNPESTLVGGATAFISQDRQRRLNVEPKAGSVLIFQHNKLIHEGATVQQGVKLAVRMDLLYEWVNKKNATPSFGVR